MYRQDAEIWWGYNGMGGQCWRDDRAPCLPTVTVREWFRPSPRLGSFLGWSSAQLARCLPHQPSLLIPHTRCATPCVYVCTSTAVRPFGRSSASSDEPRIPHAAPSARTYSLWKPAHCVPHCYFAFRRDSHGLGPLEATQRQRDLGLRASSLSCPRINVFALVLGFSWVRGETALVNLFFFFFFFFASSRYLKMSYQIIPPPGPSPQCKYLLHVCLQPWEVVQIRSTY